MRHILIFISALLWVIAGVSQPIPPRTGNGQFWKLGGNNLASDASFLGTLSQTPLVFKTGGIEGMRLVTDKLGIGTIAPIKALHVTSRHRLSDVFIDDSILEEGGKHPDHDPTHHSHYGIRLEDLSTATVYHTNHSGVLSVYEQERQTIFDLEPHNGQLLVGRPLDPSLIITSQGKVIVPNHNHWSPESPHDDVGNLENTQTLVVEGRALMKEELTIQGRTSCNEIWATGYFLNGEPLKQNVFNVRPNGDLWYEEGKLLLNNKIWAKEVVVALNEPDPWPDYVFSVDYKLLPLPQLAEFIAKNGHLPAIPTSERVKSEGVNLGEMNSKLLLKIEELTRYLIQLERRFADLELCMGDSNSE